MEFLKPLKDEAKPETVTTDQTVVWFWGEHKGSLRSNIDDLTDSMDLGLGLYSWNG